MADGGQVELEMMATRVEDGETVTRSRSVDLYRAAKNGDWKSASTMRDSLTTKITDKHETALHIAACFKQHIFVEDFLKYLTTNLSQGGRKIFFETQNSSGNTALSYAALTEEVEIATLMVDNYDLVPFNQEESPRLPDLGALKPVLVAASLRHKKMLEYLLDKTHIQHLNGNEHHSLFFDTIRMGLYDRALDMLKKNTVLAAAYPGTDDFALHVLASMPSAFVQKDLPLWRKCINFCTKASETSTAETSSVIRLVDKLIIEDAIRQRQEANVDLKKVIGQTLLMASQQGNTELLVHLLDSDPSLVWRVLPGNWSIFHIAIEKRHESIFALIHEFGGMKKLIAKNEVVGQNNMLHLAAQLAPQSKLNEVSGAALQMQRELFWFKEVEKVMEPSLRNKENANRKTPQVLFNEEHKELRHGGEKWMKDTAKSGMLVATLIATVTFAAIFSAPGGFDNFSGKPLLLNRKCFWIFWLSNATAWFSASTSIIMFLFILTSRYAEEDFLYSLPSKLAIGVTSLLVSVGSMMVAFCATFLLYYPRDFGWLIALLVVFPLLPLGYVSVKYPLLFDVIFSAYRSRLMFRWPKRLH